MPANYFPVSTIPESVDDLRAALNFRIQEFNRILEQLETAIATIQGEDGRTPTINNTVDMQGHRIGNAGRSRLPGDYVTRQELVDVGLLAEPGRALRIRTPIQALGGLTSTGGTGGGAEVVTVSQLRSAVNAALGVEVATIRDGDTIDTEDYDGTEGGTRGTLLFAASHERESDRARLLRIGPHGLLTQDRKLHELLECLLEAIHNLTAKLEGK